MAYHFQTSQGFIRLTVSGQVTEKDLMSFARIAADIEEECEVSPDRLTDLSSVEAVFLNFQSMEAFAEKRRAAKLKNRVRSAIVAPQPLQFGFARMFQTLNDRPEIEIKLFQDLESAEQWIAESPMPRPLLKSVPE